MYRLLVIPFLAILLISCQQPSGSYSLSSPDAKIEVLVGIQEGIPQYSVIVDGDMLIEPSKLGFDLRGGPTLDEALKQQAQDDDGQPACQDPPLLRQAPPALFLDSLLQQPVDRNWMDLDLLG